MKILHLLLSFVLGHIALGGIIPLIRRIASWVTIALIFALIGFTATYVLPDLSLGNTSQIGLKGWSEIVRNLVLAGAVPLAALGAYIAFRRARAVERQALTGMHQQITQTFTEAIKLLDSRKIEIRESAIHSLERLAWNSNSAADRWMISRTLTSFVRQNSALTDDTEHEKTFESQLDEKMVHSICGKHSAKHPPTDIQAAITALCIGKKLSSFEFGETPQRRIDLSKVDISGANLSDSEFEGINFSGTNLCSASFSGSKLFNPLFDNANLACADFQRSTIVMGRFAHARLVGALLFNSKIYDAQFDWADMRYAVFSAIAPFDAGNWVVKFHPSVSFEDTQLEGAQVSGVDFSKVSGLTQDQIDGFWYTPNYPPRLPDGLVLPIPKESDGKKGYPGLPR